MKRFIHKYLILICCAVIVLFASCGKNEPKGSVGCGDELLSLNNATTYSEFINNDFVAGDAIATHEIIYSGANVHYVMKIEVSNVCQTDEIFVDISNIQKYIDSLITVEATILINGNPELLFIPSAGGVFLGDYFRTLNETAPAQVIIENTITFPKTASPTGDSLRYDDWVDKQYLGINYHKPG